MVDLEKRVISLKNDGVSYRKISGMLGISLGRVQRIINSIGNKGVSIQSDTVKKCIDTDRYSPIQIYKYTNKSLAELKTKLNIIILQLRKDIKNNRNDINDINERVNRAIYTIVKRHTESQYEELLKKLREELKES